jgi:uncharacterized protein involved in type VI secretion and phage assembly
VKKLYPGVVSGLVKNLNDPAGLGRIELEFNKVPEPVRSAWARVAAPMAGKERGAFLMPEIDDEVLVAFEDGDFDVPYVVGFLWNGQDTPPESTNQNRVIKTPGGHELRFEDTGGSKKVILRSDGGHKVEIDDSAQTITVVTKSGNQKIVVNDTASSITIRGGSRQIEMLGGFITMS